MGFPGLRFQLSKSVLQFNFVFFGFPQEQIWAVILFPGLGSLGDPWLLCLGQGKSSSLSAQTGCFP